MYSKRVSKSWLRFVALVLFFSSVAFADSKAPEKIQSAMFLKVFAMSTSLSGTVDVHVMGSSSMASEFEKLSGKTSGKVTIGKVSEGASIPSGVKIIYVGSEKDLAAALKFAAANGALTISGEPGLSRKGISLSLVVQSNKPRFLIDRKRNSVEKMTWDGGISKLATDL